MPALMTPCTADRRTDFDALVHSGRRLIEQSGRRLIEAEMCAVVYCGSMGDWPLLTDAERQNGVERLGKAGLPVVVGTGAQNPKAAVAHAHKVGARGLMMIPRVLSRGSSLAAQRAHFAGTLDAAPTRRRSSTTAPITASPRAPTSSASSAATKRTWSASRSSAELRR
jgi:4-hydroxy-tetrahydrodipicolinate synthase